jgi:hypothetical protein
MREFVGKAAFVTGGASGIGLALSRAFADAGCKVMLADTPCCMDQPGGRSDRGPSRSYVMRT